MRKCPVAIALLLLVTITVFGCGKDPNLPGLHPTGGTVTLDGQPLEGAVLMFFPSGNTRGTRAHGRTDAAGRYTLTSSNLGEGVPVGSYRVSIGKLAMPDGSPLPTGKDVNPMTTGAIESLSARYNRASKLTATVPEGGNTIDFPLTSDP